jgi:hypothetical protein
MTSIIILFYVLNNYKKKIIFQLFILLPWLTVASNSVNVLKITKYNKLYCNTFFIRVKNLLKVLKSKQLNVT